MEMKVTRHNLSNLQNSFYRSSNCINGDDVCLAGDVSSLETLCDESETLLYEIFGTCFVHLPDDIKDSMVALFDKYSDTKIILRMDKSMLTPLSFDAWCHEYRIEEKYEMFHDEYGDSAAFLSDYKEFHYEEYLEDFKRTIENEIICAHWRYKDQRD